MAPTDLMLAQLPMDALDPLPLSRAHAAALLLFVSLTAFAFVGCPHQPGEGRRTTPALTTTDVQAESDLRAADRAADEGRTTEAASLYRAFLTTHASDPLVPLAHLGLGRVLLASGENEAALAELDLAAQSSDEVVVERARFHRGVALFFLERFAEALEVMQPLRGRLVDPADHALLLRVIATSAARTDDFVTALGALDELVDAAANDAEREEARQRVSVVVESELPVEQLQRAYDELDRTGTAWPRVALRALRSAYDGGEVERVRAIAEALRERHVELGAEIASLVARADRIASADPAVIGAILPLTGRGRDVGRRAMQGLALAAGSPPDGPPVPGAPQIVFRDDGGDPERAARAVEELVSEHRAIAIVGPLEGPTAQRAAQRAAELGVPLITLTPGSEPTRAGATTFRLFPTAEGEIRALVAAARARGARRFAVLHPSQAYGTSMRDLLARVVVEAGGELVIARAYEPTATSFGPVVRELAAVELDALLLPDASSRIALVAPALAAAGLWSSGPGLPPPSSGRRITVLVPSAGFDARLARTAGRYLQGAIFSAPFHLDAPDARPFADTYRARFGSDPDQWSAYAYDAFRLLRAGVDGGAATREALTRWLSSGPETTTVGASRGLAATREVRQATRLLELRGETFVASP